MASHLKLLPRYWEPGAHALYKEDEQVWRLKSTFLLISPSSSCAILGKWQALSEAQTFHLQNSANQPYLIVIENITNIILIISEQFQCKKNMVFIARKTQILTPAAEHGAVNELVIL